MWFPALGMAKTALELFVKKASQRSIVFTNYQKQDDAVVTQLQAAEASTRIDTAELLLRRSVDDLEESAASNTRTTREQHARIWRDVSAAGQMIWEAVDLLAGASGGAFAHTGHPMNRLWRDIRVATLHAQLIPSSAMEAFGRNLFGKEPENSFLQRD